MVQIQTLPRLSSLMLQQTPGYSGKWTRDTSTPRENLRSSLSCRSHKPPPLAFAKPTDSATVLTGTVDTHEWPSHRPIKPFCATHHRPNSSTFPKYPRLWSPGGGGSSVRCPLLNSTTFPLNLVRRRSPL